MSALSRRHFEQGGQGESASTRATLMAAAAEVGLDVAAAKSFLETDELVKEVWHSYGATIHQKGIHSIPLFVFNVPQLGLVGGPFRQGAGTPFVVNGSMDAPTFLRIFEGVYELFCQAAPQLGRRFDPESPFAPARRTDKASSVTRRTSSSGRHTKAASEDIVKDLITTDGDALVGCSVLLHGLTAQSDLNGKVGTATGLDLGRGRYQVQLIGADRARVLLRSDNLLDLTTVADSKIRELVKDLAREGVTGDELRRHLRALQAAETTADAQRAEVIAQSPVGHDDISDEEEPMMF
mmetsp:Transcript_48754/g.120904  ORF Transcript_48754/g.120904 Transcript_48754/m.120904 type:complete len:295 (-) Transcript_48754:317-1201(-)